jgi:16S rRNA (guanine(966)-N(2))-methyltransferase RsmD
VRIQGNRQIQTLPGLETRPTASRVREALFNIWQWEIAGCRWLDLCAGSGSMGAEALCRGASLVVGIEVSPQACKVIEKNWQKLIKPEQHIHVYRGDVLHWLPKLSGQQFERIYFDPPYASDRYEPAIEAIAQYKLLSSAGILAVEHGKQRTFSATILDLTCTQTRTYGKTAVSFYQLQKTEPY